MLFGKRMTNTPSVVLYLELSLSPLTVREELPNTDLVYVHSRMLTSSPVTPVLLYFLLLSICEIIIIVTVVILK